MMKRAMTMLMVAGLSLTIGCASITTTQKWAAGGAVLGAGAGAAVGEFGGGTLSTAEAALVGAGGGALLGALVGDMRSDCAWKKIIEEKDMEISAANERARAAETKLAAAMEDINALNRKVSELEKANAALTAELANCKGARTEMTLAADVLFKPGSAMLSDQGKTALKKASEDIKKQIGDRHLMVEGHTDKQPIKASSWKSNWDLGAARSLTVLKYLITECGVPAAKCSAATFSEYQPVSQDLAKNRRAVIVLYSGLPERKF